MTVLIDGRATHNFIYKGLVKKKRLNVEDFEGFTIIVADGYNLPYKEKVWKLDITFGGHKVCDDFYVIGLCEIDIILGM